MKRTENSYEIIDVSDITNVRFILLLTRAVIFRLTGTGLWRSFICRKVPWISLLNPEVSPSIPATVR